MPSIRPELEALIQRDPNRSHRVVVSLATGAAEPAPLSAAADLRKVIPGVYAGTLTGHQLQALGELAEVEEVVEDFDVEALPAG